MPDAATPSAMDGEMDTPKAVKDKNCPFCGQAFTSSSLGRHLDLYIKERNPKKPDGVHHLAEIRKMRGGVTRRQPKGSFAGRRHTSTPAGTPIHGAGGDAGGRASEDAESSMAASPAPPGSATACPSTVYPLGPRWEATGVINDIMAKSPGESVGGEDSRHRAPPEAVMLSPDLDPVGRQSSAAAPSAHTASRNAYLARTQMDTRQKLQDALDTSRAAELALRELIASWRAAKLDIDISSMPFDFDPLSMNFPALALQCLKPPPTLFASTQHAAPMSWAITPPGQSQYEAVKAFFSDEFRKWKIKCAAATTAMQEELTYPPSPVFQQHDRREAVLRVEKRADGLEREAGQHLDMAFAEWQRLPAERQRELWLLELARGVATKQRELDKMHETRHRLTQELNHAKSQIEQLNRLQQPREFKIMPPATVQMSDAVVMHLIEDAVVNNRRVISADLNDRNTDTGSLVSTAINRWKSVILSSRAANSGMSAQRPLDPPPPPRLPSSGPYTVPANSSAAASATFAASAAADTAATAAATARVPLPPPPPVSSVPSRAAQSDVAKPAFGRPRRSATGHPATPTTLATPLTRSTAQSASMPSATEQVTTAVARSGPSKAKAGALQGGSHQIGERTDAKDDEDDGDEDDDGGNDDNDDDHDEDGPERHNGDDSRGGGGGEGGNGGQGGNSGGDADEDADADADADGDAEEDADAEMEDGDEFAHMHTPFSHGLSASNDLPQQQQQQYFKKEPQLKVSRTRPPMSSHSLAPSRSMPSMNAAMLSRVHPPGMDMAMPAGLSGDGMYMD